MSAESDLLFPQMDSVMFSDFSNFSEYEDFLKDVFLINEIDGIALLEDLDCKDDLKPLLMSELNDFSSSLEGIKEEDEEEDMHSAPKANEVPFKSYANKPREESRGAPLQVVESKMVDDGFIAENTTLESIMSHTESNLISPRTSLATNGLSCMSLEEDIVLTLPDKSWHALRPPRFERTASIDSNGLVSGALAQGDPSITSLPLVTQGDMRIQSKEVSIQDKGAGTTTPKNGIMQLSCTSETTPTLSPLRQVTSSVRNRGMMNNIMHAETRVSIAPSIFHINSPLSSPSSISTPDGSSMLKMYGQEENVNMHHMSASVLQPSASMDSGLRSPHTDSYHGGIPRHVVQDAPASFSTMHRSRSSHALGQFRTSGHLGTCPEEFSVSSMQMPTMGFSRVSNFTPYQASCLPGLGERSSATPMRRVFSTGDIQACNSMQICYGDNNVSRLEHVNSEEHLGLKVGHYTLEERKVRLHRYRQKRYERNFSKKIKVRT
eukprot:c22458_g1_i2 orf=132-1607(+)